MKKFVLSLFVIVSFGFYVIYQNMGNSSVSFTAPVVANNTTKKLSKKTIANTSSVPVQDNSSTQVAVVPVITPSKKTGIYNDGEYIGDSVDAYYGYVQVKAVITNGRLTDVVFLNYPQDRSTSVRINSRTMPILKQEAITAQSANVNGVSGASETSPAFMKSLASALSQAKV